MQEKRILTAMLRQFDQPTSDVKKFVRNETIVAKFVSISEC